MSTFREQVAESARSIRREIQSIVDTLHPLQKPDFTDEDEERINQLRRQQLPLLRYLKDTGDIPDDLLRSDPLVGGPHSALDTKDTP